MLITKAVLFVYKTTIHARQKTCSLKQVHNKTIIFKTNNDALIKVKHIPNIVTYNSITLHQKGMAISSTRKTHIL